MKTFQITKEIYDNEQVLFNSDVNPDNLGEEADADNYEEVTLKVEGYGNEFWGIRNKTERTRLVKSGYYKNFKRCDDLVVPPGGILICVNKGDETSFSSYKIFEENLVDELELTARLITNEDMIKFLLDEVTGKEIAVNKFKGVECKISDCQKRIDENNDKVKILNGIRELMEYVKIECGDIFMETPYFRNHWDGFIFYPPTKLKEEYWYQDDVWNKLDDKNKIETALKFLREQITNENNKLSERIKFLQSPVRVE